jgi:hypothetical protein
MSDGAAFVMSEEMVKELNLEPMQLVNFALGLNLE